LITVYELTVPADCEGRSSHTVGFFMDPGIAERVGQSGYKNAGMASRPEYRTTEAYVYESLDEFVRNHPDAINKIDGLRSRITKAALDKLTEAEKVALRHFFKAGGKP
jgi:hypothetical protein